jgi:hypothetical protein
MTLVRNTSVVITLTGMDCSVCGMTYGLDEDFRRRRLGDGKTWWCPNGHTQHFVGETDEKKAKRLEKALDRANAATRAARDQADAAERRRRAAKGQLTRLKNKIAKGICPICDKEFPEVKAHIEIEHPNFHDHEESETVDSTTTKESL